MINAIETDTVLLSLGNRIRVIRIAKNLSLTELALVSDMEKASISRIETGKVNASYITLWRLSQSLKVPIKEFFEG